MNDDNAAEYFQKSYDKCVYRHGPESAEAKEAEKQALAFFNPRKPNKRVDGPRLVSTPSLVALT